MPKDSPQPRRTKVAIVGFAPHWDKAPYGDESWEIWGLNELYIHLQKLPGARADRWFELHNIKQSPTKSKPEHRAWLKSASLPIYMQEQDPDVPTSVRFPADEIMRHFKGLSGAKYFTNSISWMIALALFEGFEEVAVYGVDMATNSEYSHQRPSCEYWIGVGEGMGRKVWVYAGNHLLKSSGLYGYHTDNGMRIEMRSRIEALRKQIVDANAEKQKAAAAMQRADAVIMQARGAIEVSEYYLNNWVQGE